VIADAQDELGIVDAVCNAASDASDETREAALQWLLMQRHDEVSVLVCDSRVESMCFRVDCFLFAFIRSINLRFICFGLRSHCCAAESSCMPLQSDCSNQQSSTTDSRRDRASHRNTEFSNTSTQTSQR
jgi:hypothetical protein